MEVEDERGIAQLFCETLCLLCGWQSLIWTPKWGKHQCMNFWQGPLCLCKPTFSWFVKTILFPQFSSLQNRDFLKFTLVPAPRLPQLFRQTFDELSEARDNEYKKLTGKAESSDKKKKKMRSAGVASHCDTSLLSHLWMSVQSVSFWEPWTVERGMQWFQAFPSTAGHLATPGVHVSFLNIMEIKYRLFSVWLVNLAVSNFRISASSHLCYCVFFFPQTE